MNAIGYIRISTKDQSQYSLTYQERNVREYAQKNDVHLLAIFKDDGESSYTFDRPDWLSLEDFIRKNKNVHYLIIFDHDRFSRNLAEALFKIKELQDKFGIKVLATTDSFDTDFSDPSTFLMRAFKYMMAEGELWRIRQRTKSGMVQAALNGRYVSRAPWGYLNGRDDQNKPLLKIDEEKSFIIRMVFKEFLLGTPIEQIRRLIIPLGYPQKGNSALQDILSNPVYAGLVRVPSHKDRPEQIIQALHPGIISEEEFWRAQAKLNCRNIITQLKEDVPLRGVLKHSCGKVLTAGNSKGRKDYYWYYVCHACKENFPARKMHAQFNEILDTLSFSRERIAAYTEELSRMIADHISQKGELIARTEKALRILNEKIQLAEERYLNDHSVSKQSFHKVSSGIKSQQADLQKRLFELKAGEEVYWKKLKEMMPKLHDLRSTFESLDLQRKQQFIRLVFDNSLMVEKGVYRTAFLHEIFQHNAMELKEKNLLLIEKVSEKSVLIPVSAPWQSSVEPLMKLADILAA